MADRNQRQQDDSGADDAVGKGEDEARETPTNSQYRGQSSAASAYNMVASVLLGLGLGYGIDHVRDTSPFWTVFCTMIFLIVGLYQVVKDAFK